MPSDRTSNPQTQTRREFIGFTCPLVGFGAASSGGFSSGSYIDGLLPDSAISSEHASNTGPEAFHDFPDNPFIVPAFGDRWFSLRADFIGRWLPPEDRPYFSGWEPTTFSHQIRTVVGLHLDALDSHHLANFDDGQVLSPPQIPDTLSFARQTDIPTAAGWNYTINLDHPLRRYGSIMEAMEWQYPDGTPVDNPRDLLALTFDGQIQPIHGTRAIASAFAPGILDLLVHATEHRFDQGFTGFFADGGVGIFVSNGLDFSGWATAAFQDHLSTLPGNRLAELGIDDPHEFDIQSYFEAERLTPDSGRDPRDDPVFREYLLHHHLGIKAFCQRYRQAVKQRFPERMEQGQLKLWTNHFLGNFEAPQAPNIYTSDAFDIINAELYPTVLPGVDFVYKLLRAMGRFSKPVMAKGTLSPFDEPRIDAFDPETPYRMLQRFQMAEAYANGVLFKPALTITTVDVEDALTHWIQADGTVPERLQSFIDFVWAHRRFLDFQAVESDVRCAVVWSLPTRLWRYEPQWGIGDGGDTPRLDSFVGTVRLLREAQIPYDIIVFGHPRLWDDAEQLERLTGYDAVLLPGVECLTGDQVATLQTHLEADGSVITSGLAPQRDEMFVPDDAVAGVFERDDVTVLAADPGYQRATEERSDGSLIDALEDAGVEPVTTEPDPTLSINRLTQPADARTMVHLLNYDYTPETDVFTAKDEITLRLSPPEHSVGIARYYSPQRITDLDFTRVSNRIELTIPELVEWGFVVLASSADDLVDATAESNARELIDEGNQLIDDARESGRDWGPDFAFATTKLEAATTAFDYDAYGQAETAATAAIEGVAETYPRPVIGVDQSHNQSAWEPPSWMGIDGDVPFWWLEENFEEYPFEMLDGWNPEVLEAIDILLVPPTLSSNGSTFGFEADELDRVERFVSNGGSIVIIGDWRAASDIDDLTDRFGFRFHGQRIQFPEGVWGLAPTTASHPLTRGIDVVSLANATPIDRWPETAEILASVSEGSPAWLTTEPPQDERNGDEELASGAPVFAHGRYGEGHVVLLGSPNFAFAPMHADPAMRLVSNLLSYLGRESVRNRDAVGAETPSPLPSPSSPTATTPPTARSITTTDGQPGYSIGIGVVGILAGVAGYVRRAWNESDDS